MWKAVVFVVSLVFLPAVGAQCSATIAKINKIGTTLLPASAWNKIIPILISYAEKDEDLQTLVDDEYDCFFNHPSDACLVNQLLDGVPVTQYGTIMGAGMKGLTCLQQANYTTSQVMAAVAKPLIKLLNSPYKKCCTKANTMAKAGNSESEIESKTCAIATGFATQKLIQKVITLIKTKITAQNQAAWKCATNLLPSVITRYSLYKW